MPSHALVELFVQNAYFAFQVVQVFLVTTLTSATSAALSGVLMDPLSAKDLLSQNLPKASNFYLSYILVQCLASGAARLANVGDLIRHEVIGKATPNPRRQFYRWRKLTRIHWGSEYPRFTNMGVIGEFLVSLANRGITNPNLMPTAISYSCIAPLILVFAGLGMFFISYVYRYCLIYVFDSGLDTKGLFYPRALMQLMMGLYVAEICLIGLFILKSAFGPMCLMVVFFIFSALVHISLKEAVTPLLYNLPRTLALEKDIGPIAQDDGPAGRGSAAEPENTGGLAADYYDMGDDFGDDDVNLPPSHDLDTDIQLRGIEGSSSLRYSVTEWTKSAIKNNLKQSANETSGLTKVLTQIKIWLTPDPTREAHPIMTFLHPEIYQDFRTLQPKVNPEPGDVELPPDYAKRAYWPPEMWAPAPKLWVPKDDARVSRQEVAHTKASVFISDEGCRLSEKGRLCCDFEAAPLHEPVVLW